MSTFAELEQSNPNIRAQYDEWRDIRASRGQDAAWWPSFREHVMALGAPDPGDVPPEDWVGPDYRGQTH